VAVHSYKDLPTARDERFAPIAVPPRVDPSDVLIARDGLTLDTLPEGARVGTSAPRRRSQLAAVRPDLDLRPLRGNIDTRMGYVTDGELDAGSSPPPASTAWGWASAPPSGSGSTRCCRPRRRAPSPSRPAPTTTRRRPPSRCWTTSPRAPVSLPNCSCSRPSRPAAPPATAPPPNSGTAS